MNPTNPTQIFDPENKPDKLDQIWTLMAQPNPKPGSN